MERKTKIQELKGFTLNRRYRAWSHRTPCARLLLWAQEQRVPFPLHPALSAPFAWFPSFSSSEAPLAQGEGTQPTPQAHTSQYILSHWKMRVRDDLRQMAGEGKSCSFGFTTYIHFNTSVPGETSKHLLLMLCTAYPLTYCPLIHFVLNRHYCPKEHSFKLVQFRGKKIRILLKQQKWTLESYTAK